MLPGNEAPFNPDHQCHHPKTSSSDGDNVSRGIPFAAEARLWVGKIPEIAEGILLHHVQQLLVALGGATGAGYGAGLAFLAAPTGSGEAITRLYIESKWAHKIQVNAVGFAYLLNELEGLAFIQRAVNPESGSA